MQSTVKGIKTKKKEKEKKILQLAKPKITK